MKGKVLVSTGGQILVGGSAPNDFLLSDSIYNLQSVILQIRHSCRDKGIHEKPDLQGIFNMERWKKKEIAGPYKKDKIYKVFLGELSEEMRKEKILFKFQHINSLV